MTSPTCVKFLPVEFMTFFLIFLAGLATNVLFVLLSYKTRLVNAKGYFQKYNIYLVHWSFANLILLLSKMPFEAISVAVLSKSWIFGGLLCSYHNYIERGLYFSIATHLIYMIRDVYQPFGFPNHPRQMGTNWGMSLLFMTPLLLSEVVYTKGGCPKCTLERNPLAQLPVFQWTEVLYVAVLPLVALGFYSSTYGNHPDYENFAKEDPDGNDSGISKVDLREMCVFLAILLSVCSGPARFVEMAGEKDENWPMHQSIFHLSPRLLIYGQTVGFILVCATYYPSLYDGAKILTSRLWACRQLPEKFSTVKYECRTQQA